MTNKTENFAIEIPVNDPEVMGEFQKAMDKCCEDMNKYTIEEAEKLGVSIRAMSDILYLRTRSRWTQEKEDYLIKLAKEGKPLPNVMAGDF
jgi:hypothetical protein